MNAYKMAVANVARYIRSSENWDAFGEPGLDAYTAAHVLAKAFCKMHGEVLQDIINVEHHEDLHERVVKKMREG